MCKILFVLETGAVAEHLLHKSSVICVNAGVVTLKTAYAVRQNSDGITITELNEWKNNTRPCPVGTMTRMCDLSRFFDTGTSHLHRVRYESRYLSSVNFLVIKSTCLGVPVRHI